MEELQQEDRLIEAAQRALSEEDDGYWDPLLSTLKERSPLPSLPDVSSIPTECWDLYECLRHPEEGLSTGTRLVGLRVISNAFSGDELVRWIMKRYNITSVSALTRATKLFHAQFIRCQTAENGEEFLPHEIYKCFEDIIPALNTKNKWYGEARSAQLIIEELRTILLVLEEQFIGDQGRSVDYQAAGTSEKFKIYKHYISELQRISLDALEENERKAFFINAYNMLMIHGLIEYGAPSNYVARHHFFHNTCYVIDGQLYSLHQIEHGILRGNRIPPGSLFRAFSSSDPRLLHAIIEFDPRIHFALVCGAKSCPPVKIYSADALDEQLQAAAESFVSGEMVADREARQVTLSQIFSWFAKDFGATTEEVLLYILPLCRGQQKEDLARLLAKGNRDDIQLCYSDYNWNLNSAPQPL